MGRFTTQFPIVQDKIIKSTEIEFRRLQKMEITQRTNHNSKQKRENDGSSRKCFDFAFPSDRCMKGT